MAKQEKEDQEYKESVEFSVPVDVPDSAPAAQFARAQLIESELYAAHRDALAALLEGDKLYTAAEVEERLGKFLNKEAD